MVPQTLQIRDKGLRLLSTLVIYELSLTATNSWNGVPSRKFIAKLTQENKGPRIANTFP